jgi:uncharacterized protein
VTHEQVIYPERISTRPQVFEGDVDLADFPDLADSLANGDASLHYIVTALLDANRRKVVSCIIEGFVFLTCQSSLEAFRHDISVRDRLVLVDRESELPPIEEESEAEDFMVADGPIDVPDLVEEAVLLALPMVPRKPGLEDADVRRPASPAAKESPFAALERLRKKPD